MRQEHRDLVALLAVVADRPDILRKLYSSVMAPIDGVATTVSVSDASRRGVAGLVADAERGSGVVVSRRGKPAAAVIGVDRLERVLRREDDLRLAALVLARAATDTGDRTSLDDVLVSFGFDRAELQAELDAELAAEP
jgi:prevent-host-death family protein